MKYIFIVILIGIKFSLRDSDAAWYNNTRNQYYFSYPLQTNWFFANRNCNLNGMNLVSISTMKKKEEIDDFIENFNLNVDYSKWSEQIWTSGNDFGHEGDFFWMGNGKGVHLSNWIETEYVDKAAPDNKKRVDAKDSCIAMWNYNETGFLWNYHVCSNTFYFLCELSTD